MTIKEIAKLAGVSISTVSKIVNNKDQNINAATRERVLKIVKEYNYTPYGSVKNLSTAKTFLLGVLLNKSFTTSAFIDGILKTAQKHGYRILLLDSDNDNETELKHISALCRIRIDGLIWKPVNSRSLSYEKYFTNQNIPICYLDTKSIPTSYCMDYQKFSYAMTDTLLTHHHKHITCLFSQHNEYSETILNGVRQCLFDNNFPADSVSSVYTEESDWYTQFLLYKTTSVLSADFLSTVSLCQNLDKSHFRIPNDLSIISVVDDDKIACTLPSITCLTVPYKKFGEYICRELIQKCESIDSIDTDYLFTYIPELNNHNSISTPNEYLKKKILVMGSISTDYTFRLENPLQPYGDNFVSSTITSLGGKGANQAVQIARLGHQINLVGNIGNDSESYLLTEALEKEGINTKGLHRDNAIPTGKAYMYLDESGESTIVGIYGANNTLTAQSIHENQVLFQNISFCVLNNDVPFPAKQAACKYAKQFHSPIIFKPSYMKKKDWELMQYVDIIVPNLKEAAALAPSSCQTVDEQAHYLRGLGISTVIITLGNEGCYLCSDKIEKHFPAADFTAVDTTGGCDAFIGTLAVFLTEGYSIEKSITLANYAAGFCVSRMGVYNALINRDSLVSYLMHINPELLNDV